MSEENGPSYGLHMFATGGIAKTSAIATALLSASAASRTSIAPNFKGSSNASDAHDEGILPMPMLVLQLEKTYSVREFLNRSFQLISQQF